MTFNNSLGYSVCQKPKTMYCYECKEYTQSIEPILISRYNKQTFSILAMYEKCNDIKNYAVSDDLYEEFFFVLY